MPKIGPRTLRSIFFGGGTPSLMAPQTVAAVIERATARFAQAPRPRGHARGQPHLERGGPVQRLPRGGRQPRVARRPGARRCGAALSRTRAQRRRGAGCGRLAARLFDRFSFDLIYGRPGQTAAGWAAELSARFGHADGHLSVYQLTIEPGTRFELLQRTGALTMPADDVQADLYELTQECLAGAGLPAYEISNHARPGEACRHNLLYWRSGEWLGIGPGAHGRLDLDGQRFATEAWRLPRVWLERTERTGSGERTRVSLSAAERVAGCW